MPEFEVKKGLLPKTYWITYGLQSLSPEKFRKVVQKILDGKYVLLTPHETSSGNSEAPEEDFSLES